MHTNHPTNFMIASFECIPSEQLPVSGLWSPVLPVWSNSTK